MDRSALTFGHWRKYFAADPNDSNEKEAIMLELLEEAGADMSKFRTRGRGGSVALNSKFVYRWLVLTKQPALERNCVANTPPSSRKPKPLLVKPTEPLGANHDRRQRSARVSLGLIFVF